MTELIPLHYIERAAIDFAALFMSKSECELSDSVHSYCLDKALSFHFSDLDKSYHQYNCKYDADAENSHIQRHMELNGESVPDGEVYQPWYESPDDSAF